MKEYQQEYRQDPTRKEGNRKASQEYRQDPVKKAALRVKWLKGTYSLTPEEYEARLVAQGGGCAICGKAPNGKALSVDHNHDCCPGKKSCGKCIRGLLCQQCNMGLGHFKDDTTLLRRAINYLGSPEGGAEGVNEWTC
jgi:hypothetical protein